MVTLVEKDGKFNEFNESVLAIDYDIDCIYDGAEVYIFNKISFETIFSFMDKFINEIKSKILCLQERAIVDNPESLEISAYLILRKLKNFMVY